MKKLIIIIISIILISCGDEESNQRSLNVEIGDKYLNGIVFHIFPQGHPNYVSGETHGYVVSNLLGNKSWGCVTVPLIQFTNNGQTNTSLILDYCGGDNAAGLCNNNEWFLPSRDEFLLLLSSNVLINNTLTDYYWTSNKVSYSEAIMIRPADGNISYKHVNYELKVLGIKQF